MANITVQMKSPNGVTLATKGKYCPQNVKVTPALQSVTVAPSLEEQTVTAGSGKVGLSQVTVEAIQPQEKTVNPTNATQIITPDSGYLCLSKVTVNAVTSAAESGVKIWSVSIVGSRSGQAYPMLSDPWLAEHRSDNNLCLYISTSYSGAYVRNNLRSNSFDFLSAGYGLITSDCHNALYQRLDDSDLTQVEGSCYITTGGLLKLKNGSDLYWSDGQYLVIAWLA